MITGSLCTTTGFSRWGGNASPAKIDFPKFVDGPKITVNVYEEIKAAITKVTQMNKKLHLVTAVIKQIDRFHANFVEFSAFDVTKALRERVATGEYDIVDVTKDDFGGQIMPVIAHKAVREIVVELFDLDMIPDYKGYPFYDSTIAQSYVKYSRKTQQSISPAPAVVAPSVPAVSSSPVSTVANVLKTPDAAMWTLVDEYLRYRPYAGTTGKQIQSRLKGYKVTCEEIYKHYKDSRTVWTYGGNVSKYQY